MNVALIMFKQRSVNCGVNRITKALQVVQQLQRGQAYYQGFRHSPKYARMLEQLHDAQFDSSPTAEEDVTDDAQLSGKLQAHIDHIGV